MTTPPVFLCLPQWLHDWLPWSFIHQDRKDLEMGFFLPLKKATGISEMWCHWFIFTHNASARGDLSEEKEVEKEKMSWGFFSLHYSKFHIYTFSLHITAMTQNIVFLNQSSCSHNLHNHKHCAGNLRCSELESKHKRM